MVALLVVLADCDSASSPTPSRATSKPSRAQAVASALAREASHPDPNFDYGFTVQVTASGFLPHWLVAACCQPITWKNLTSAPASIVFDHLGIDSGPIAPGGTYVLTPKNVESIAYHRGGTSAVTGVVQVNPTAEP